MAAKDEKINSRQIQFLQARRRQLGISDDVYAEMKKSVEVESTRDLTVAQFDALVQRMNGSILRGSRRTRESRTSYKPVHDSAYASGMHHAPPMDRAAMISKVEAILTELGKPWSYADTIAAKQTNGKVSLLRFCNYQQTYRVLQSLCVYQERLAKREEPPAPEPEVKVGDAAFYIRELRSEQCQCGRGKKSGKSFCYSCWKRLPEDLQRALYRRIGEGYEAAYERAVMHLDKEKHQ